MPIYEYFCEKCDKTMEFIQEIDEPEYTSCPECGSNKFHKKVSVSSFKLKGKGWYETDFKNSGGGSPSSKS